MGLEVQSSGVPMIRKEIKETAEGRGEASIRNFIPEPKI